MNAAQRHQQPGEGLRGSVAAGSLFAYAGYQMGEHLGRGPNWLELAHLAAWGIAGVFALKALPALWRALRESRTYARALRGERIKGSAAFMSVREARKAGLMNWRGGMPLGLLGGRPVAAHTETHVLVNGPAGSGKTVNFFFPLLMHRENACLVMDPKGEGFEVAAPVRQKRMKRRIVKLDPLDPNSAQVNPLDLIRAKLADDNPEALTIARIYALQLHPEPESEGQNKFFRIGARRIITALLLIVSAVFEAEQANLTKVYRLLIDEEALNDALMRAATSALLGGEIAAMAEELHREAFGDGH